VTLIVLISSCKKPYLPPVVSSGNSYLVVEGTINGGLDPTVIKLSRTVKLSSNASTNPVTGAVLTVEDNQAGAYPLTEITPGSYSANLSLNNSKKYRLRIKTPDNQQFVSDFVAVINSPSIDSISYKIAGNGLNIYSNTHDSNNNTRYYRWDYQETWMIHSNYASFFKSNGDTVLGRDMINDDINTCWLSDASSNIIINSSAKLIKNVIADNPVTFIASTSEKLGVKYSILVRQYSLTSDAYNFWVNLKKNTEQLGSIFDAQPSQINGNIHSVTNPSQSVIGYITAGSVSSQRIFIENRQLPNWLAISGYASCTLDSLLYKYYPPGARDPINQINQKINYNKGATYPEIPVNAIGKPGSNPIGYTASKPECVDCTLRGTNKQPAFWR